MTGAMGLLQLLLFTLAIHGGFGADPVFTMPVAGTDTANVNENVAAGTTVFTAAATDADGDTLTFTIASQDPAMPVFTISTADLLTPAGLDAETERTFLFTFNVSDGTTVVTSVPLNVTINDLEDVAPAISALVYTANVLSTAANGDAVGVTVSAIPDVDGDTIVYSFTSGNLGTAFAIAGATGVITVADTTMLNATLTPSYTLVVQATDGTNPATVNVDITVDAAVCSGFNPIGVSTSLLAAIGLAMYISKLLF